MNRDELEHCLQLSKGQRTAPSEFWQWMGILFLAVQAVVGLTFILQHPGWPGGYLWLAVALGLCYWAVVVAPRAHERALDELQRNSPEVEFRFGSDGFTMRREDCNLHVAWSAVRGFRDSESLIQLIWENNELPVARRWFHDDREFSRLVIFLGHKTKMLSLD